MTIPWGIPATSLFSSHSNPQFFKPNNEPRHIFSHTSKFQTLSLLIPAAPTPCITRRCTTALPRSSVIQAYNRDTIQEIRPQHRPPSCCCCRTRVVSPPVANNASTPAASTRISVRALFFLEDPAEVGSSSSRIYSSSSSWVTRVHPWRGAKCAGTRIGTQPSLPDV